MKNLQQILNELLNRLMHLEAGGDNDLSDVLFDICTDAPSKSVVRFLLNEQSTNQVLKHIEQQLRNECPSYSQLSQSVSYLLDELTCNMQQHSHANEGLIYANFSNDCIEIVLADHGISIYGSYVQAQKYLDLIGNSDAEAVGLAKDGYSTKDLPNAENRGYGISSNIKMVTGGLKGEFAIYSGNALFVQTPNESKLLELPEELDMQGTMVVVRIPTNNIPENYSFYEYIS